MQKERERERERERDRERERQRQRETDRERETPRNFLLPPPSQKIKSIFAPYLTSLHHQFPQVSIVSLPN